MKFGKGIIKDIRDLLYHNLLNTVLMITLIIYIYFILNYGVFGYIRDRFNSFSRGNYFKDIINIIELFINIYAIYIAYKAFNATRKKPEISLEYNHGKWLLKNVGDANLYDVKIKICAISLNDGYMNYDGMYKSKETMRKKYDIIKGKEFSIYDLKIGQTIEINGLFLGEVEDNDFQFYSNHLTSENYFIDTPLTSDQIDALVNDAILKQKQFQEECNIFIKSIESIELVVIGKDYKQPIKYLRNIYS